MNRQQLMSKIQQTGFALYDTSLFLDSHPECKAALEFFAENQRMYDQYMVEYEKNFGPLRAFDTDTGKGWTWIQGPWPWELEA